MGGAGSGRVTVISAAWDLAEQLEDVLRYLDRTQFDDTVKVLPDWIAQQQDACERLKRKLRDQIEREKGEK